MPAPVDWHPLPERVGKEVQLSQAPQVGPWPQLFQGAGCDRQAGQSGQSGDAVRQMLQPLVAAVPRQGRFWADM